MDDKEVGMDYLFVAFGRRPRRFAAFSADRPWLTGEVVDLMLVDNGI